MKLTLLLMVVKIFAPDVADLIEADIKAGKFTVAEGVSLAEAIGAYVSRSLPADAPVIGDATALLVAVEQLYEKVYPDLNGIIADVQKLAADIKALKAASAPATPTPAAPGA